MQSIEATVGGDGAAPLLPPPGVPARLWIWLRGGASAAPPSYWLTRFFVLRLLGLIYLMAFLTLALQGQGLLGTHGLTPLQDFLADAAAELGSRAAGFRELPSIFWWRDSDAFLVGAGWVGVALAAAVTFGFANMPILFVLWALQLSITNVGQTFYAFGWESQLAETGFLCIFLCPALDPRPFPGRAPPRVVIWLLRWLVVRIMLGSALIKLRGDPCWRDLTCLDYHFETQPIPGPLTPLFHALPAGVHKAGVLYNHFIELVVPFFAFGPRRARHAAGALLLSLQVVLILSGNLSFLNWLTVVPILACFDDGLWARLAARLPPAALVTRAERARAAALPSRPHAVAAGACAAVVAVLSVQPVLNLLSSRQMMNTSFDRFQLVNTYGAFGAVGRERMEIVLEGTRDDPAAGDPRWTPYEWKCKPGDPARRPCLMSPYHHRLDWLIWFAAMRGPAEDPWAVHLVAKLLDGEPRVLALLAGDPFEGRPPRFIRAELYRYRLASMGAPRFWERTRVGEWLPPLGRDDPGLRAFLHKHGWFRRTAP